jgi:uncharacterized protein (DUF2252 family)
MIADLIEPERRPDAYALLRTSHNAGVAVGPAVGGLKRQGLNGVGAARVERRQRLLQGHGDLGSGVLLSKFGEQGGQHQGVAQQ